MNPDAEQAVTERYRHSKERLQNELQDQLKSRMENLDEQMESLEYIREKAELCATEAKVTCYQFFSVCMAYSRQRMMICFQIFCVCSFVFLNNFK